ncbi:hypothetical protein GC56T3_3051 [Geobacillus sp. C56-T3]|nr:hypothetical protein GC56T3_3051 [Geobacillus sp. C56-T3]
MGQQLLRAFTTTILKKTRCFTNLLDWHYACAPTFYHIIRFSSEKQAMV